MRAWSAQVLASRTSTKRHPRPADTWDPAGWMWRWTLVVPKGCESCCIDFSSQAWAMWQNVLGNSQSHNPMIEVQNVLRKSLDAFMECHGSSQARRVQFCISNASQIEVIQGDWEDWHPTVPTVTPQRTGVTLAQRIVWISFPANPGCISSLFQINCLSSGNYIACFGGNKRKPYIPDYTRPMAHDCWSRCCTNPEFGDVDAVDATRWAEKWKHPNPPLDG